jgi:polyribonucleotide nucleotidyltransferase
MIIEDKIRVDGRKIDEIRLLTSEIDILPRVHGSSLFTRGETQALVVATLGVKADEQRFDGLEIEESKNFMLHYNFPPFSVGECGRMGAPGRREIGHGHLAEKAISTMLPTEEEFPYTIRVVSEILESNGSSSQASICGASLALMAAGVPIKKPVAGIAMGMIADSRGYTILTDIQGLEDHLGDMDFKVAGTKDGICAIQMDMKIDGISKEMLTEALEQARVGRMEILDHMNSIISEPREELSEYAPKVLKMNIEVNQIKDVIGRGGDTINKIIDETNVKIDIEEDGTVRIYGTDQKMIDMARDIILKITKVYKVGDRYMAKVSRVETYGAFVRFEDQEGLLHISDLSDKRVEKVEDVVNLNDIIEVEIKEIDIKKRIKVKLVIKEVE